MNISNQPITMSQKIRTYTELLRQIHHDLRIQHPEWVGPHGECPKCDSYKARLTQLLNTLTPTNQTETSSVSFAQNAKHFF